MPGFLSSCTLKACKRFHPFLHLSLHNNHIWLKRTHLSTFAASFSCLFSFSPFIWELHNNGGVAAFSSGWRLTVVSFTSVRVATSSSFSHGFSCASKRAKSAYGREVVCYCLRNRAVLIPRVFSLNKCDNLWMKVVLPRGISQSRLKVLNDGMKRIQKWYRDTPKK